MEVFNKMTIELKEAFKKSETVELFSNAKDVYAFSKKKEGTFYLVINEKPCVVTTSLEELTRRCVEKNITI